MARLFAVDGRVDLDDLVVALNKARDLDGRAVWDLFIEVAQQLFAHDLAHDLTVGLVSRHAVGEELRALRGVLTELVHQIVQPLVRARGNGDNGVKRIRLAVGRNDGEQVVLFLDSVDLVDAQNRRQVRSLDLFDELGFRDADVRHWLNEQQHRVHVRDGFARDLDHVVAQAVARLVESRRVEQHVLRVAAVHHAVNAVARGLGLVRHDGDLLAHKGVRQAGFADVRPSADSDHSGFRFVHDR